MAKKKTEPKTETFKKNGQVKSVPKVKKENILPPPPAILKEEVYYEHDPLNQIDERKTRMVEDK